MPNDPTTTTSAGGQAVPAMLLSAADAARALAISPRKLWELTQRGDIPTVRIGRRTLYDPRDLRAYIDAQRVGGAR